MNAHDLFVWPEAWPLLLGVPIAWLLLYLSDRHRAGRLVHVAGARAPHITPDLSMEKRVMQRRLFMASLFFSALSILQPTWGESLRRIEQRGVDIMVCLDVSRSMLARDIAPSRLSNAQQEIRNMAEQVHGDRLGLIAFAGEARLMVPLTQDSASFAYLASQAGPLSVELGGTDLGLALGRALDALMDPTGEKETIVLITDGEDLGQRGLQVAQQCLERNVRVHCVGFGSRQGSKIAVDREEGESFLRDLSGEEVVSTLDAAGLREIARITGGEFIEAGTRPQPLLELYRNHVIPMTRKVFDGEERRERKNQYQWFLLAAFLLFMMEYFIVERKP